MPDEKDTSCPGPEGLEPREESSNRMFAKLPAEIQDLVWYHAAEEAGPQMLYLDVEQFRGCRRLSWHLMDHTRGDGPRVDEYSPVDQNWLDAKMFSRRRLSEATRPVRSLGQVCREARKWVCRCYPDVLGLRFRTTNERKTRRVVRHGPADGSENGVTLDHYTMRINGKRDLCVLALSDWVRQTYALRNPDTILSSLVPRCIRHMGLVLDTLFNNRIQRMRRWGRPPCPCPGNMLRDEERFPLPHPNPGNQNCVRVCRWEPFVPFLKAQKGLETVVLVGVSNPLLATSELSRADGAPPSRRIDGITSWEDADDSRERDTSRQCTRAFDGNDSYAFIPVHGTDDSLYPVLRWIQDMWRREFPYEPFLPGIKFRAVRREKTVSLDELNALFSQPRHPISLFGCVDYTGNIYDISDDETDGKVLRERCQSGKKGTLPEHDTRSTDDPCVFELEEPAQEGGGTRRR